jgi:hypothetical protein
VALEVAVLGLVEQVGLGILLQLLHHKVVMVELELQIILLMQMLAVVVVLLL